MRRKHDNNYLHFTKKERSGIIAIITLTVTVILFFYFLPILFPNEKRQRDQSIDISRLQQQTDSFKNYKTGFKKSYQNNYRQKEKDIANLHAGLFYFDPNTISAGDWKKLGLRQQTIRTIENYLAKGGRFRDASELKKIWGLEATLADRLVPYVVIDNTAFTKVHRDTSYVKTPFVTKKLQPIDINNADSLQWVSLPGIGAKLSQRIIIYRNKLGGFYSATQVGETFGLPDSTFKKLLPVLNVTGPVKKLNINTVGVEELKAHPYIRYHLANAIIQYRQQHTTYSSVSDIKNIMLIDDSIYKKISPYLSVD
ncbi:MAG: helix-hairpin-helix domain-containing protein [Ferruginibacter sp.]